MKDDKVISNTETKNKPQSGRKKGFKVSEESKKKKSDSEIGKIIIVTPLGEFGSYVLAAAAHNTSKEMIRYFCKKGEIQRERNAINIPGYNSSKRDYTGFKKVVVVPNRRRGRPVRTPLGDFNTVTAAADAHNVTPASIIFKIKRPNSDYQYLD